MATPVRKSHISTADLLTWPEAHPETAVEASPASSRRSNQPSEAIKKVVFGGQVTEEEFESLNKRKPCSAPKWKELTGSGIFVGESETDEVESTDSLTDTDKMPARTYQQAISSISQISFTVDEDITPKKPTSVAEIAKQRELSGSFLGDSECSLKKLASDAKCKELSGNDIFGPPPEGPPKAHGPRNFAVKQNGNANGHTPAAKDSNGSSSGFSFADESDALLKTAKKMSTQKFSDLTGNNNIFKEEVPPATPEKSLSTAKLKEISGNDIFADGKAPSRDYLGGVRKPPGGESTIALI